MNLRYDQPVALILTSNPSKASFLKKCLQGTFYFIGAETQEEAFKLLKNTLIDMIFLDEKTAKLSPFNFCPEVRHIKGYETTPIFLITTSLRKAFIFKALNAGVSDFLHEPLDQEEIYQRIAVALKSQERLQKMGLVVEKIAKQPPILMSSKKLSERFLLNEKAFKEVTRLKNALPLNLLMIEMDGMDSLISEWGNPAFEEVQAMVKSLLSEHLRKNDSLFPQGNGKFLMILPKTSPSAARAIGDTLRKEIKKQTFSTKKANLSVTVSIGLISYNEPFTPQAALYHHFESLLLKANLALEQAKKRGNSIIKSHS